MAFLNPFNVWLANADLMMRTIFKCCDNVRVCTVVLTVYLVTNDISYKSHNQVFYNPINDECDVRNLTEVYLKVVIINLKVNNFMVGNQQQYKTE